jgi:hypothetical protein
MLAESSCFATASSPCTEITIRPWPRRLVSSRFFARPCPWYLASPPFRSFSALRICPSRKASLSGPSRPNLVRKQPYLVHPRQANRGEPIVNSCAVPIRSFPPDVAFDFSSVFCYEAARPFNLTCPSSAHISLG